MGTKWHLGRWVIFHDHEVDTGLEDIDLRLRDGTSRAFCGSTLPAHNHLGSVLGRLVAEFPT